ncbi:MAG TPA: DNA alkylation repair protein [Anaerolineae bacterium]|nr:DNA alkylation repair protein [Anaerolineae bacterium]
MKPNELATDIIAELESLPEMRTAPMRRVRKKYSKRLMSEPAGFVLEVARSMINSSRHRWAAYELIHDHPHAFRSLDREKLEDLGRGINSWSTVDSFSRTLSGPAWRVGMICTDTIRDWAHSSDRWWRRAALVSTVALNIRSRGGEGDVDRTLAICQMLVDDHDDMIVKALSWVLRELSVHDPVAVRKFLSRNEHILAARVKREVRNKLETGLKNP